MGTHVVFIFPAAYRMHFSLFSQKIIYYRLEDKNTRWKLEIEHYFPSNKNTKSQSNPIQVHVHVQYKNTVSHKLILYWYVVLHNLALLFDLS